MTAYTQPHHSHILGQSRQASAGFRRFTAEVKAFAAAFISPNRIIGEVEQMVALQREARQIAATNPQRANELRLQAMRIGR